MSEFDGHAYAKLEPLLTCPLCRDVRYTVEQAVRHVFVRHAKVYVDGRGSVTLCPCGFEISIPLMQGECFNRYLADHLMQFDDPVAHLIEQVIIQEVVNL